MFETLLLLCCLAIVAPVTIVAVLIYNFRRQLRGLEQVSGGEALQDMLRQLLGQKGNGPSANSNTRNPISNGKAANKKDAKPDAEDAEFTEIG